MNKTTKKKMRHMETLRLPELQAQFAEIVGEATRCPSKKYLLRRIAEALELQDQQEPGEPATSRGEAQPRAGSSLKVVPVRIEASTLASLDEARQRLGFRTRMELFRMALGIYLTAAGESDVAQVFAEQS